MAATFVEGVPGEDVRAAFCAARPRGNEERKRPATAVARLRCTKLPLFRLAIERAYLTPTSSRSTSREDDADRSSASLRETSFWRPSGSRNRAVPWMA